MMAASRIEVDTHIFDFVETCKLTAVYLQADLVDVLTRLVNLWPAARMNELIP